MMRRSAPPPIIRLTEQSFQRAPVTPVVSQGRIYQIFIGSLAVLAVLYNGLLAMMGAAGIPISPSSVVIFESLILVSALFAILRVTFSRADLPSLLLAYAFLGITIYLSVLNEFFFPDTMRNVAIIALFTMLGLRATFATVRTSVLVLTMIAVIVLVIEISSVKLYVSLFEPAQYFFKTRGFEIPSWDKSGLFSNALGFKERFSFGLSPHRTSSLFLEQVSFANYAAFLTVFLISLWSRLPVWQRIFYVAVVVAILVTNNTRTSLILAIIAPIGYFIYPRMPRYLNVMIAPLLLTIAWIVEDPNRPYADDFAGRLSLTIRTLQNMDLAAVLGQKISHAAEFVDSGYTYFTYAATLPGLALLWIFIAFYLPQRNAAQKRFAYSAGLLIACSLVVGGTSIFTIKVASMIWFVAGFMRTQGNDDTEISAEPVAAPEVILPARPVRPSIARITA